MLCGLAVPAVFARSIRGVAVTPLADEGGASGDPRVVARLSGSARAILTGERTALNFLSACRAWRPPVAGG